MLVAGFDPIRRDFRSPFAVGGIEASDRAGGAPAGRDSVQA
jgi:hypothetical protein